MSNFYCFALDKPNQGGFCRAPTPALYTWLMSCCSLLSVFTLMDLSCNHQTTAGATRTGMVVPIHEKSANFSWMVLLENFALINACSQLASALISVFWLRGSHTVIIQSSNVWMRKLSQFFPHPHIGGHLAERKKKKQSRVWPVLVSLWCKFVVGYSGYFCYSCWSCYRNSVHASHYVLTSLAMVSEKWNMTIFSAEWAHWIFR